MIRAGSETLALQGLYGQTRLDFRLDPKGRTISIDSKPQTKSADYLSCGRVTWFANQDLELVKGGGSLRRRYLDFLGSQCETGYSTALRNYERALRSRNSLLRENRPRSEIAAFDPLLIESGNHLIKARWELSQAIAPLARAACSEISGGSDSLEITYQPGCKEPFAQSLAESRPAEDRLRQTVCGPHRDDIQTQLNGLPAASFASEGQQRTVALALKLAQARHLAAIHGKSPVLLMDDIFGELDALRRNRLLASLPVAQTLITTTFLDWTDAAQGSTVLHLESGRVTSSPS